MHWCPNASHLGLLSETKIKHISTTYPPPILGYGFCSHPSSPLCITYGAACEDSGSHRIKSWKLCSSHIDSSMQWSNIMTKMRYQSSRCPSETTNLSLIWRILQLWSRMVIACLKNQPTFERFVLQPKNGLRRSTLTVDRYFCPYFSPRAVKYITWPGILFGANQRIGNME